MAIKRKLERGWGEKREEVQKRGSERRQGERERVRCLVNPREIEAVFWEYPG